MEAKTEELINKLFESYGATQVFDQSTMNFAVTVAVSAAFGFMLKIIYELYFQDNEPQDGSLARSLVILAPTLTGIFWMIQNSLVLSLGLVGSLSLVRFRAPVKRAEDISFIVVMMAVSIACAIGNYGVAIIIVSMLYGYSFLRNSKFGKKKSKSRFAILTFNSSVVHSSDEVTSRIEGEKIPSEFISSRTYDGITSFVINLPKISQQDHDKVINKLSECDKEAHINIIYPNERLCA